MTGGEALQRQGLSFVALYDLIILTLLETSLHILSLHLQRLVQTFRCYLRACAGPAVRNSRQTTFDLVWSQNPVSKPPHHTEAEGSEKKATPCETHICLWTTD